MEIWTRGRPVVSWSRHLRHSSPSWSKMPLIIWIYAAPTPTTRQTSLLPGRRRRQLWETGCSSTGTVRNPVLSRWTTVKLLLVQLLLLLLGPPLILPVTRLTVNNGFLRWIVTVPVIQRPVLFCISILIFFLHIFFSQILLCYVWLLEWHCHLLSVYLWRLYPLCRGWNFLHYFALYCSPAIWLGCRENSVKMFAAIFWESCYVQEAMKNCNFRPISRFILKTM